MTTDNEKDTKVNETNDDDDIENPADEVAEKTNLDYAVEDADEIMDKLLEYGSGDFTDEDSRKLFRQWLIEKLESVMDEMEQGVQNNQE